jgi:hypothetical protein
MTTLEGITDVAAVQGLKAVEDTALATLVAIERAYEAAMAQVALLATNRVRVMAPRVVEMTSQVVAAPPAPIAGPRAEAPSEAPSEAVHEVTVEVAPEPRVSPLVGALQALQVVEARAEVTPEPQPAAPAGVTEEVTVEVRPQLPAELPVQLSAEVVADDAVEVKAAPIDAAAITEVVPRPRLVDAEWVAGRHAEAKTDQIPVQAA